MLVDPLIARTIAVGLGLMFVAAALHKLRDLPAFRVTLIEYELLPAVLVAPAAFVLPLAELLLGAAWLTGILPTAPVALASALLLAVYALAIGVNIGRGRVHFDCGCGFGGRGGNDQYLSAGLIVRNLVLAALASLALLPQAARDLHVSDYLAMSAALLTGLLLFGAANQLLSNRSAINTWRKPRG